MKIALGIEYDGEGYRGWQRQAKAPSIQATLEDALAFVADHPVQVFCAGRTDAGVHALGQVVHFTTNAIRSPKAWLFGVNQQLPHDVAVTWSQPVAETFHARFSALARTYRYVIRNHAARSALQHNRVAWYCRPVNIELMQQASMYLIGEHDFSSFRAAECQAKTAMRRVEYIKINRCHDEIQIIIKANAFLHNMVRTIVGTLLQIGTGEKSVTWMATVLNAQDRKMAGMTAPAAGLYLYQVDYPEHFAIPISAQANCISSFFRE